MDLDFRDHPELARALVQEYVHRSSDFELRQLLPFYQCYRAYVRGKVESLKSAEPEVPD
jgi:aminoglycoside phosphotransferase family enzyme